jgi:hypothetical protein
MSTRRATIGAASIAVIALGAVTVTRGALEPPPVTPAPHAVIDTVSVDSVAADTVRVAAGRPADVTPAPATLEFAAITDGVQRVQKPDVVRGIYLNAWAAGSATKLARLIALANRTEINAFVIDVKEGGEVSYRSRVPLVRQIGADRAYIRDVRAMLSELAANNVYAIARIVVFRDQNLAAARPDWAVRHVNGGKWVDREGNAWVDSFNKDVWDYNIAIAREALELGFSEIQWDYVRFPDVPQSLMRTASWPARAGRTKADGIREFLLYSRAQLESYNVPVTADVFGLTVSVRDDLGIGQSWDKMVDATDVLLPMVYPSHFARGTYGVANPNASPHDIVLRAMQHAVRRTADVANAATIRPWLQDFTLGSPRYTAVHVRAQIDAVYAAGLKEWVLWNPASNYTETALREGDGVMPDSVRMKVDTVRIDTLQWASWRR